MDGLIDWWRARRPWQKRLLVGAVVFLAGFIAGAVTGG
jgi:hypothetical protein